MALMWHLKERLCSERCALETWDVPRASRPPLLRCCMLKHAFESSSLCLAWKRWAMNIQLKTSEYEDEGWQFQWLQDSAFLLRLGLVYRIVSGHYVSWQQRSWDFDALGCHCGLCNLPSAAEEPIPDFYSFEASDAFRAFRFKIMWSLRSLLRIATLKCLKGPDRMHKPAAIYSWNERQIILIKSN